MKRFIFSIRARLLLLVLLAILPALGLTLYTGLEQRQIAAAQAQQEALWFARSAADDQRDLISNAHQLLLLLAQLPQVRTGAPAACSEFLASLPQRYPRYASFIVTEPNGDLRCSAIPASGPVNYADRDWFVRVLQTRDFVVGSYAMGRVTARAIMPFAYPILSDGGQVQAVLGGAIDLAWLNQFIAEAQLPPDHSVTVIDRNGAILARHPDPERWVGQIMPEAPIVETILARQTAGTAEMDGLDGVRRLFAFTPLVSASQGPDAYVAVGIPSAAAFAESNRLLRRNLIALGLVTALALALAWGGAEVSILRRVKGLLIATRRLAGGDPGARAGPPYGVGELSQLARAFDQMAESLQQRAVERGRAEEALRLAEEKYRNIFENAVDGIFQSTPKGRFLMVNPAFARMLGYGSPEELAATITDIGRQIYLDSPRRADFMQVIAEQGSVTGFEFQMRRKDGSTLWVSENARTVRDAEGTTLYYEGTAEDITRRKRAEEALHHSEMLLKEAQTLAKTGSWEWEIVEDQLSWSDELYQIFEKDPRQFTPTNEAVMDSILPEDRPMVTRALEASLTRGEPFDVEYRILDSHQRIKWLHSLGKAVVDNQGNPIHATGTVQDITERKNAAERIARQNRVLNAINEVFQEALTCETEEAIARKCLAVAEQLTGSKFGFLGEVNPAGLFDTIAISNPGWDACKLPESNATRLIRNMPIRGIDRSALREGKSRTVNDPATHPDRVGVPAGHPPITAFLGVPLKQAGKTIGMIGLANREGGYTDTQREDLETLAVAIVETLMRKRAEIAARRHLAQIEALREIDKAISSTLDLTEMLDIILKELERVVPYHSAAIFLLSDDTAKATAGRGFPDMKRVLQVSFPVEEDLLLRELLQEKRPLVLADARTDTRFLARGGTEYTCSWIGVPLMSKGKAVGILTIDHREPGVYGEEGAEMAEAFANQVAIAVENARLYEASRRQAARAEALVRIADRLNARLDLDAVLNTVCQEATRALNVSAASATLYDSQKDEFCLAATFGLPPVYRERFAPATRAVYEGSTGQLGPILMAQDIRAIPDAHNASLYSALDLRGAATAMLQRDEQLIGSLTVYTIGEEHHFTEDELILLHGMAEQAALAISNARLYAAQQETNAQLLAALQANDEMIQNVSHELRTPLTTILGYAQLLGEATLGDLTAEQQRAVEVMSQQGQRLSFMVNRLLILQTFDAEKLRRSEMEVGPWLAQIVMSWQVRAAKSGILLAAEVESGLPAISVDVDFMGQVMENLLDNAFKFSPEGGAVTVRAWQCTQASEVCIAVSDQGVGIPRDKLDRLFTRFFQINGSTTRRFSGVGIGLALCKKIIEAHGGRIWVESEGEGRGSAFCVTLPIGVTGEDPAKDHSGGEAT